MGMGTPNSPEWECGMGVGNEESEPEWEREWEWDKRMPEWEWECSWDTGMRNAPTCRPTREWNLRHGNMGMGMGIRMGMGMGMGMGTWRPAGLINSVWNTLTRGLGRSFFTVAVLVWVRKSMVCDIVHQCCPCDACRTGVLQLIPEQRRLAHRNAKAAHSGRPSDPESSPPSGSPPSLPAGGVAGTTLGSSDSNV